MIALAAGGLIARIAENGDVYLTSTGLYLLAATATAAISTLIILIMMWVSK